MSDPLWLDVAQRIATTLCRDAIRDGDRCNWLGDAMQQIGGQTRTVHRSFGGDLYGGTSGIALFLAQMQHFRPDPILRDTARSAIEHALRDGEAYEGPSAIGFYTGASGIAFAAIRIGELLDDASLIDRGLTLLEHVTVISDTSPIDILTGAAGVIAPLLTLRETHARDWMLDRAIAAGELLLRTARTSERGTSWNVLGEQWTIADLTGYSHGAAGMAAALLELAYATRDPRYAATAESALQYERTWFDPQQQNWPDLRRDNPMVQAPISYSLGWCHGAPGIGLSRLRAFQILQRPDIHEEAAAALRGTYGPLSTLPATAMFALCHGATGNAELFLEAEAVLGDPGYRAIAEAIGRMGIERFHEPRRPWVSGLTTGGDTPTFMLGLAGIGYFYLRLYDAANVPSLLLVKPRSLPAGS